MPEIISEVKTFLIEMQCNKCKKGMMKFTGHFELETPTYHHQCNNCNRFGRYKKEYPVKYFRKIKELNEK